MQIGKAKKEGKIHKDKDKCKEKDNLNGNAFSKMWKIWIKLQNAKNCIKNAKKYCDEITWHLLMSPYSNYTNQGPSLLMNGQTIMKYRQEKGQKIQE